MGLVSLHSRKQVEMTIEQRGYGSDVWAAVGEKSGLEVGI